MFTYRHHFSVSWTQVSSGFTDLALVARNREMGSVFWEAPLFSWTLFLDKFKCLSWNCLFCERNSAGHGWTLGVHTWKVMACTTPLGSPARSGFDKQSVKIVLVVQEVELKQPGRLLACTKAVLIVSPRSWDVSISPLNYPPGLHEQ